MLFFSVLFCFIIFFSPQSPQLLSCLRTQFSSTFFLSFSFSSYSFISSSSPSFSSSSLILLWYPLSLFYEAQTYYGVTKYFREITGEKCTV
jgi:hypothetical protein